MSAPPDDVPSGHEDEELLAVRLRAGDVAALDEVLRKYWRGIAVFATRALRDPEAADDIAQETFIRLWRARAELVGDRIRAYLYRVARNLITDELRRRDVRARWAGARALDDPQIELPPDERLADRELGEAVAKAVDALPPRRREAFTLAFLHGLSYAEAAQVMGVSMSTVKNQVSSALADLRVALAKRRTD